MTDVTNHLYETIDAQNGDESAATRRGLVKGTAVALGSLGLMGLATGTADAASTRAVKTADANKIETIAAVAATAEILATIVNTVGAEKLAGLLDATTLRNVQAAAQQEKNHYEVLTSKAIGGKAVTDTIYVPDEVFSSPQALLTTLAVGDQVFINAYLLATTVFARQGTITGSKLARYAAEIMGVEAVHRALALQSLGQLGNDRAYSKFAQREDTPGLPTTGSGGFYVITDAVTVLESAGFGFGKPGSKPGTAYKYDEVAARTPTVPGVNTLKPS
ncbi:ferritin-like domain-containing protein [Patulibacter minatonensis]|uniref:ferritin-like domain-containing protein n=1 Tax=Patulibacter minatonensis TaxID=298163 RepID=UPI00047A5371|nr:ferritin-like domain-containing protein [Patulibacter minatonensis]